MTARPSRRPPRSWCFSLPMSPIGNNKQYRLTESHGGKALTAVAKDIRRHFTNKAKAVGFEPTLTGQYGVRVELTVPTWNSDIDGPLKGLLDAVFLPAGRRQGDRAWDHRIVDLRVTKAVVPGVHFVKVTIWEVAPPEAAEAEGRRRS